MTRLVQLWIPRIFEVVDYYACLFIATLNLIELVLVRHLINPLLEELSLCLQAEVT